MLRVSTIIDGMDTRPATVRRAIREATDYGLEYHRRRYLPMHFKAYAYNRYGSEYTRKKTVARSTQTRKRGQERRSRGRSLAALDGTGKWNRLPLVHSGVLQEKMLRGGVRVSGRWDKRAMTYSPPFYSYASPVGQLDKVRALTAMLPAEEVDIVAHVEKRLFAILENNRQTQRG